MTRPVRMTLTDRVEVFGLAVPIDWPAGTVVEAVAAKATAAGVGKPVTFEAFEVTGPDGLRCTLPARLLEPTETQGR